MFDCYGAMIRLRASHTLIRGTRSLARNARSSRTRGPHSASVFVAVFLSGQGVSLDKTILGACVGALGTMTLLGVACTQARDAGVGSGNGSADAGVPLVRSPAVSVLSHHNSVKRSGSYVQSGLTATTVQYMHRDPSFGGQFTGLVRSQPLYVADGVGGKGTFYVSTESNDVHAFDESGALLWTKNLGPPADNESAACVSKFTPIGITGTPTVDPDTRTLYVDSVLGVGPAGARVTSTHLVHALSLDDGAERAGWPVDPSGLMSNGHTFDPTVQNQRGALLLAAGMLYVPYGSVGDCGDYHGWIVGIPVATPDAVSAYSTPGRASGIWAPNGVAFDEGNIFVATGNSNDPQGAWAGGEAVLRFPAGVPLPASPSDVYAPPNWYDLDQGDIDLGGSGVLLLDMPNSTPSELALALGKDGFAYLLDQHALGGGGQGTEVAKVQVMTHNIVTAPATFTVNGRTFVATDGQVDGVGVGCPPGQEGDLVVFEIIDGAPPTIQVAWCADNDGHGSPMATSSDGVSDAILWTTGDSSGRLRAYDGVTGTVLFDGGDTTGTMSGLHRFNTVIAVEDRIIVAGNDGLYAFTPFSP